MEENKGKFIKLHEREKNKEKKKIKKKQKKKKGMEEN